MAIKRDGEGRRIVERNFTLKIAYHIDEGVSAEYTEEDLDIIAKSVTRELEGEIERFAQVYHNLDAEPEVTLNPL